MNKDVLKEILNKLKTEKSNVKPEDLLELARSETSPIHQYFDWNDTTAAEQYRLWQARQLIATVKVEWEGKEKNLYWNATITDEESDRAYFSLEETLSDEKLHLQVLKMAIKELKYFQDKYDHIKELQGIININKLGEIEKQYLDQN